MAAGLRSGPVLLGQEEASTWWTHGSRSALRPCLAWPGGSFAESRREATSVDRDVGHASCWTATVPPNRGALTQANSARSVLASALAGDGAGASVLAPGAFSLLEVTVIVLPLVPPDLLDADS